MLNDKNLTGIISPELKSSEGMNHKQSLFELLFFFQLDFDRDHEDKQELIRVDTKMDGGANSDLKEEETSFLVKLCNEVGEDEVDVLSLNKLRKLIKDIRPCKSVVMEILHTIERINNDVSIE